MRNLVIAMAVVGMMAVSSYGLINVSVTADSTTLAIGASTTVRVWAQGTAAGMFSLGGSVNATGTGGLSATGVVGAPNVSGWAVAFAPTFGFSPVKGAAGVNGGWSSFGSEQTNYLAFDPTYAKAGLVDLFDYTVQGVSAGQVTLTFAGASVGGFKPAENRQGGRDGAGSAGDDHHPPDPGADDDGLAGPRRLGGGSPPPLDRLLTRFDGSEPRKHEGNQRVASPSGTRPFFFRTR